MKSQDLYEVANSALNELITFIKNPKNDLDERFSLFERSIKILPVGKYLSDWSFTSRDSKVFEMLENPYEHCTRGLCDASLIIDCYLFDTYSHIPKEVVEQHKDAVPVSVHIAYASEENKIRYKAIVDALLSDCLSGAQCDW